MLFAATEGVAAEVLRDNRGWSAEEWNAATDRLRSWGLVEPSTAQATAAGRTRRDQIEQRTDELASQPFAALADDGMRRLLDLAAGFAEAVATSGVIPFPNPMGLPPATSSRG